jgi:hypothetical protein
MSAYRIARLSSERIDQAYPLVNLLAPALGLDSWRTLCGTVMNRDRVGEVIAATNPLGYIQGICIVALRNDATLGRLLDVPFMVIASAADEAGVAADMLAYLKTLGRAESCGNLRIWTSEQDSWRRCLRERDLRPWDHGFLLQLASETSAEGSAC